MTQIGTVYGQALYDLAKAEGLSDEILQQTEVLREAFDREPDLLRLLAAPNLSKNERCGILDDSFQEKIHPYLLNFLKILTEKGYSRQFPYCAEAYREHYNLDHGILPVKAVTAIPLTPEQSRKLCEKLSAVTGKTIVIQNRVEPGILGGIRLDYDGKRLDDTVAHRLDAIRGMLSSTVL